MLGKLEAFEKREDLPDRTTSITWLLWKGLYDDLVEAEYDAEDVQDILDRLEDELIDELDEFGEE
jgi:hypothetical protein